MFRKMLFATICFFVLGSQNPAKAQPPAKQIFVRDGEPGSELGSSQTHSKSGSVNVPCTGCTDNNCVSWTYYVELDFSANGYTTIVANIRFTNNTDNEVDFMACAMGEWEAPAQSPLVPHYDAYTLHKCDGPPCEYYCTYNGSNSGTSETDRPSWSYYFGCQRIQLAPHGTRTFYGKTGSFPPGQPVAYDNGGAGNPQSISLSMKPPDDLTSTNTWNFDAMYVDIYGGDCLINTNGTDKCNGQTEGSCDALMGGPNMELDLGGDVTCRANFWIYPARIAPSGGVPTTAASCDVGNIVTMTHMDTSYPAVMYATIANAPAGTEATVTCPYDTLYNGEPVLDSAGKPIQGQGSISTDTTTGCGSDTLGLYFPLLIPAMAGGHMTWKLTLPTNSCSDIGNGRRIYLHGEVFATKNAPEYDSGQFMYGVAMTFILDTTPPTVTNFSLHAVDSTHLAISLTGSDDTTTVSEGYVVYSINGGTDTLQVLPWKNDSVGLTSTFIDTIVSPIPNATIDIRGFVENEVGLLDSTVIDTCHLPVISPASVQDQATGGCHVEMVQVDPAERTITLKLESTGGPLRLSLTDELGRVWPIAPSMNLAPGEEIITRSFPDLPHGAYFLRLQTGTCDVLEKVIL